MYEIWYDYIKQKYGEQGKLCYMDTNSFIVHVKADDIYKDIAEDVETTFYTSNYEIDRPLPMGKNEQVIGLMKDKLGGQIMNKFVGLSAKTYSYLKYNDNEYKKSKRTKKCVRKRNLKFRDYKKCLKASQIENILHYLEKNEIGADSLQETAKYKKGI